MWSFMGEYLINCFLFFFVLHNCMSQIYCVWYWLTQCSWPNIEHVFYVRKSINRLLYGKTHVQMEESNKTPISWSDTQNQCQGMYHVYEYHFIFSISISVFFIEMFDIDTLSVKSCTVEYYFWRKNRYCQHFKLLFWACIWPKHYKQGLKQTLAN